MTKQIIAKKMLALAKELLAVDFGTKEEMDKYLKDHPGANRSNHKVVKTKKAPVKKAPVKKVEKKAPAKQTTKSHPIDKVMDDQFERWWEDTRPNTPKDEVKSDVDKLIDDVFNDYKLDKEDDDDYKPIPDDYKKDVKEYYDELVMDRYEEDKDWKETQRTLRH